MKPITSTQLFSFLLTFILFTSCSLRKENAASEKQKLHTVFKTKKGQCIYFNAYDKTVKALWKTPFEETDLDTPFGKTHVIISGPKSAPPLVLLHGMNASSTMWYPNAKAFSQAYRVYCIDLIIEPGKSASNGSISKVEDLINWYDAVFDKLKLEKFPIVGESRGGWLAMQLALNSKKNITKLVLLSPAQAFTWIKPRKEVFKNLFFELFPRRSHLRNVLKTLMVDVDKLAQQYIDQYYIAVTKTKKSSSILQVRPFTDDELKALNIPVLLLIGDADIINNTNGLERAKTWIPNIKTAVVKRAGHFISFDQPEIVNKITLMFLKTGSLKEVESDLLLVTE